MISHDFGSISSIAGQKPRPAFELLLGGLTFDLVITAVGQGHMHGQYFNARETADSGYLNSTCAFVLVPGPHLAGAEGTLLIVRAQWALGAKLASAVDDIAGVGWRPSATVRSAAAFVAATEAWGRGGPVPSPGLITFQPVFDNALQSAGLAHFTGQEVRMEPDLAGAGEHAVRLGQQIAHMLIHRGALNAPEQFTGPAGETIRLEPSANGRVVRVWPG